MNLNSTLKTQEMPMATRSKTALVEMLQQGVVSVKFTKSDGSERTLKCTLNDSYIQPYEKKTERVKKSNEHSLSVWDVENNGWRSFRFDSVLEFNK